MINFKKFNNIISLTSYFTTDAKCKQAIIESRWSDGDVVCPYCGGHHCVVRKDGKFRCKTCGKNFSCLVGTIFENTKLSHITQAVQPFLTAFYKFYRSTAILLPYTIYFYINIR